jgi:hypothetical protein
MAEKKVKKNNWKLTDNRFVAFFDILGFKDLVMRTNHKEIYDKLNELSRINKILKNAPSDNKISKIYSQSEIYTASFSDSVVFFSKDDDITNFKFLIIAIMTFMSAAIAQSIPIKGGIAHGKVSINKSKQIYFGQPIIDAYLIQEDVNYFGITAHNSIDAYIRKIKNKNDLKYLNNCFFEAKTTLKCGKITHKNINWFKSLLIEDQENLIESLNKFKSTVSGSPRRYVDNTFEMLEASKSKN